MEGVSASEVGSVSGEVSQKAEQLRWTDPSDYIQNISFQRFARSIDSDPSHPWEIYPDVYFYKKDTDGEFAAAVVFDEESQNKGFLIASRGKDSEARSIYLPDLNPETRDFVVDAIKLISSRFSSERRQKFIEQIIESSENIKDLNPDEAAKIVTKKALELMDNNPEA